MDLTEKTIGSSVAYQGRIVTVREDSAELFNGAVVYREVVDHPGGVAVIPVDADGSVIAVRQFRYPFQCETLEVPAGKLEPGEDPLECAVRELGEETGISAGRMISLGSIYTSPGYSREQLYLYLALDLCFGCAHPDENEFLNVERVPLQALTDRIMNNEIRDAKTVVAVLKAARYLGQAKMTERTVGDGQNHSDRGR